MASVMARARQTLADGSEYKGEFVNDVMHGEGAIRYADGKRYKGAFLNGKPAPDAAPRHSRLRQ